MTNKRSALQWLNVISYLTLLIIQASACRDEKSVSRAPEEKCRRAMNEAQCESAGGRYGPHGKAQRVFCICPTPDEGKPCTDAEDCSGYCECHNAQDTRGKCSKWVTQYGCTCKVYKGKGRRLCKD